MIPRGGARETSSVQDGRPPAGESAAMAEGRRECRAGVVGRERRRRGPDRGCQASDHSRQDTPRARGAVCSGHTEPRSRLRRVSVCLGRTSIVSRESAFGDRLPPSRDRQLKVRMLEEDAGCGGSQQEPTVLAQRGRDSRPGNAADRGRSIPDAAAAPRFRLFQHRPTQSQPRRVRRCVLGIIARCKIHCVKLLS
ncbi:hypothetical protein MTO96_015832 [Rhipicephalus appendiculatus]